MDNYALNALNALKNFLKGEERPPPPPNNHNRTQGDGRGPVVKSNEGEAPGYLRHAQWVRLSDSYLLRDFSTGRGLTPVSIRDQFTFPSHLLPLLLLLPLPGRNRESHWE